MKRMYRYAGKRKRTKDLKHSIQIARLFALFLMFLVISVFLILSEENYQENETNNESFIVEDCNEEVNATEVHYSLNEQNEDVKTVRYELTDYERDLVERVVMSEAEGEGYDGQRLVAQCILNTAEFYGIRPDEVVLQPNQYASPSDTASEEVKEAVSAIFDDGDFYTEEPIRWFYAKKWVTSEWHESKCFVLEYGGHRFFKEW